MSRNQTTQAVTPIYGNQDHNKIYAVKDLSELEHYIVRQSIVEMMNGGMVIVPNTTRIQTYSPANWKLINKEVDGHPSFVAEAKMKIEILHDPTA